MSNKIRNIFKTNKLNILVSIITLYIGVVILSIFNDNSQILVATGKAVSESLTLYERFKDAILESLVVLLSQIFSLIIYFMYLIISDYILLYKIVMKTKRALIIQSVIAMIPMISLTLDDYGRNDEWVLYIVLTLMFFITQYFKYLKIEKTKTGANMA